MMTLQTHVVTHRNPKNRLSSRGVHRLSERKDPMNESSSFRTYVDDFGQLPPEVVLGYLAVTSVKDAPYDARWIESEFKRLALDTSLLPSPLRPDDAYEKATKVVDKFKYACGANGELSAEVLVREAVRDTRQIVRQLTREVRDQKGRKIDLDYDKVGDLVFYKPTGKGPNGTIDPKSARVRATLDANLSPSERATLDEIVKIFAEAYKRYCDFHDGQKIRGVLRQYLLKLNGVMMQDSLYFIHASRADELQRLQGFVHGLKTDGVPTAKLMLIPLADLPHLRKDVVDAFQREAAKELEQVVTDIAKLRDTRKNIRPEAYAKLKGQYDKIMTNATEYSRTLNISLDTTAGAMQTALYELQALQRDLIKSMQGA